VVEIRLPVAHWVATLLRRELGLGATMTFKRSAWRHVAPVTRLFRRRSVLELPRRPRRPAAPRNYLAISTMVRDESLYLAEWLAFHRIVGVDHVYIYDNGSTDDSPTVLKPFVQSGFVTVIPWTGPLNAPTMQQRAYHHGLTIYGPLYRWIAFIDVDEFLFPAEDAMLEVLSRYEGLPAVAVPWTMFGTSGHKTRPDGLVIESYTMRGSDLSRPKSIVQPSEVRGVSNAHLLDYDEGRMVAYNERGELVGKKGPFYSDVLRLHHYYTRSEEELARKRDRSITSWRGDGTRVDMHVSRIESAPQRDLSIARFIPKVKAALAEVVI
jgi:hypothetical protein